MRNKLITAVAVLTLGASLAVAAVHEGGWGNHEGKGRGEYSEKLAQKLNLTDAQKQQLADLEKNFREQNASFLQSFRQNRQDYRAAMNAGDTAKADSLKATLESQRAQMKQLRDAQDVKISSILTPEQRAQWQQLKAERAARHQSKQ